MKTLLISLLVVIAGAVRAQQGGTVVFGNSNWSKITNSQTSLPVSAIVGVKAALYWAPTNSTTFTRIDPPVNVGVLNGQPQGIDGIFAGGTRTTGPETTGGSPAQFQVRAWSGNATTYEQALPGALIGQSPIVTNVTGAPAGTPPTPPAALVGLQGFILTPKTGSTASAGGNQTICVGSSTAGLGGSAGGGATGGVWSSSGTGTFSPDTTTLNATYNPSPTDITLGTVTLTLTSTGQFPPATAQVVVTFNPAPTASAGGNQTICAGSSTAPLGGSAGGGATGGAWSSSGTGTFSPNATTLNATYNPSSGDVTAGTVTLTLTSTGQLAPCGAATAQVVVTIDPPLTVAAGSDQTICANSPVGIGTPTVSGGTGPYTYSWSPATGLSDQTAPNPTATVGITTTYTVTVTDAKGCMGSAPVVLTVIPRLTKRFYRLVDSQQGALRALVTVIPPPNIVIALSGTTVMLAWYPLAGHTFVVQFKNDLTDASWTNLPGVVTLNGSTATMVDSIGGCP